MTVTCIQSGHQPKINRKEGPFFFQINRVSIQSRQINGLANETEWDNFAGNLQGCSYLRRWGWWRIRTLFCAHQSSAFLSECKSWQEKWNSESNLVGRWTSTSSPNWTFFFPQRNPSATRGGNRRVGVGIGEHSSVQRQKIGFDCDVDTSEWAHTNETHSEKIQTWGAQLLWCPREEVGTSTMRKMSLPWVCLHYKGGENEPSHCRNASSVSK